MAARRHLALALLLAGAASGCSTDEDAERSAADRRPVSAAGLVAHLRALERIAERNGGDRAAGTPGYAASVRYVAGELRAAGWRVRLQEVPLRLPAAPGRARLSAGSLGALEPLRDFRALSYSGAGRGRGALRPAGEGCATTDLGALAPGEVALVRSGGCFNLVKARNAARAGALALLVAADGGRRGVPSATLGASAELPVLALRGDLAGRLAPGDPVALRVDTSVSRGTTTNVIAERGRGRRVAMAGAHLDSVPAGPGINDNGSGVAALLATAQAYGTRPPGRVRLAFWGAEELALVGSSHYVEGLSVTARRRIAGYLNLDMVGSPNAVPAVYDDGDRRLTRLLRAAHAGREAGVSASGRSDHAPFEAAGIPVGGLYTGSQERGPDGRPRDPCYHLPCDGLANVDRRVLLRMARATTRAVGRLARQAK